MELKLTNGLYESAFPLGLAVVSGREEHIQRIMMKLRARRGRFSPLPAYGSRFFELHREKPSRRATAALQYAAEALRDEGGVTIEDVAVAQTAPDSLLVTLTLALPDGETVTVHIGE